MTTHLETHGLDRGNVTRSAAPASLAALVPVGRLLFSAIFVTSGLSHFSSGTIAYGASQGVPAASILVPLSGLIALLGGLSVLVGYKARWGAGLLVLFLVPVTFTMHAFWAIPDASAALVQQAMFMKNLAMLGTALLILYFGAGPYSADDRQTATRTRSTAEGNVVPR